ncbi:MAG: hypothetical protein ACI4K5_06240, partial [Ruminococcus sp.]
MNSLDGMKSAVLKLGTALATAFSVKAISDFSKECKSLYQIQADGEIKLATIMKQRMNATDENIQSIKDYASALQESGVIGDEVQLAGAQQVATFLNQAESLKLLMPAMNNLLAQQNGLNASAQDAVNIGNMMGKVMQGQIGALTRVGITFSEAEEQVLKYGNESERASMLAKVITNNVGEMNQVLAKTDLGRQQQLSNTLGDIKEQFGSAVTQIEVLFLPALKKVADTFGNIATLAQKFSQSLANVFSKQDTANVNVSGFADSVDNASESYQDIAENAEQTAESVDKSLAGFDEINKLSNNNSVEIQTEISDTDIETIPSSAVVKVEVEADTDPLTETLERIKSKLRELAEPVKIAWEDNSPQLIESVKSVFSQIKELIKSIGKSFVDVWANGTGEQFISNILVLLTDVFNIIGDIAEAFRNAWNDNGTGEALIQSYFDRWNSLLELIHTIADDFREVWNNGTGIEVCKNIFEIVTNINETVANLRERFALAWKENDTGKGIIQSILDIFNIILGTINEIAKSTSEWSEKLDFSPLLTAIQGLLESLEPLSENIGAGLEWFYKNVLLPLAGWTIEDVIPAFIDLLSGAIDVLNSVIEVFKPIAKWLWDKFLKPVAEWTGGVIVTVIEGIANALKGISDWISKHKEGVQDFIIIIGSLGTALAVS